MEAIRARRAAAQGKLQGLRQRGNSAWEYLKEGAEKTWRNTEGHQHCGPFQMILA
ncbi:MAG: sll1863 family stress response protein [Sulfuricella sp.]